MVKWVYCFRRLPSLTADEFAEYWKTAHGPIGAAIPGLKRLVQRVAIPSDQDVRPPDYDGVAELWFDDLDALNTARDSPEWQASAADEVNFIDHTHTGYFVSEERTIL